MADLRHEFDPPIVLLPGDSVTLHEETITNDDGTIEAYDITVIEFDPAPQPGVTLDIEDE